MSDSGKAVFLSHGSQEPAALLHFVAQPPPLGRAIPGASST
jgi:hypothetical protein